MPLCLSTTVIDMVCVEDILIIGNNSPFLSKFVDLLANRFSIKDQGHLNHFLGIEIIPTKTGLFLSQHSHVRDILTQLKIDGAKEVTSPLRTFVNLMEDDNTPKVDTTPYRKLVDTL